MKKKIVMAVLAASMIPAQAFAAVTVSENADTRLMTAGGSVEGGAVTGIIAFDAYNQSGERVYADAITTADGEFRDYHFRLPDVTGVYTLKFSSFESQEQVTYEYYSTADLSAVLDTINAVVINDSSFDDEDAVVAVMNEKSLVFDFAADWYGKLGVDAKREIAADILKARSEGGYASVEDIRSAGRDKYVVNVFKAAKAEDIEKYVSDFAEELNFAENVSFYETYTAFATDSKLKSGTVAKQETVSDKAGIYTALDRGILIAAIESARDPKTIRDLIDNNTSLISFDLATYNKSDKDTTASYIYKKTIGSMAKLGELIDEAYKAQSEPGSGGGTSSSSSGGSGSSRTGITLTPQVTTPQASVISKFDDLSQAEWAASAINALVDKGVVSGMTDNTFEPMSNVTREQFVTLLVNAFGISGTSENDFDDIPKEHWAYKAVSAAAANGVVSGISDTEFGAGRDITRQDMAVMAANAASNAGYTLAAKKTVSITDMDKVSGYAVESVEKMAAAGIINGYDDESFRPMNNATRAEAAVIIYAIMQEEK